MDDSILDFYESFLLMFSNKKIYEIIQGIRNWLEIQCRKGFKIFKIHQYTPIDIKEKIGMIKKDKDILCDWRYIM